MECLRSVAPLNGQLSFELFVAGLQKSLIESHSSEPAFDVNRPPPKPLKPLNLQHRSSSSPFIQVQPSRSDNSIRSIRQVCAMMLTIVQAIAAFDISIVHCRAYQLQEIRFIEFRMKKVGSHHLQTVLYPSECHIKFSDASSINSRLRKKSIHL